MASIGPLGGLCAAISSRIDVASVFVYAGSILPGVAKLSDGTERDVTIIDAFEAVGACARGLMSREDVDAIERAICPGEGACGGMYTANTMASAIEALGMSLPNSSAQAAVSEDKMRDCFDSGAAVLNMIQKGIRPRDIMTRKAFENAITVVIALGGSTNAVLHLLAMAHAAEVPLSIDDFTEIGKRVPLLADLKPSGKFAMADLVKIGGTVPLMRMLLEAGLLVHDNEFRKPTRAIVPGLVTDDPPQPKK